MTNWIDQEPAYPFALPQARDLQKRLVNAFYEPSEIRTLIQAADGPDWKRISFSTGPDQIWNTVLERASAEGSLRILLQYIIQECKVAKPLESFIRSLLEGNKPAANSAPSDAPQVDDIGQEEALLFGDSLSESVGAIPELLSGIGNVMQWSSAVCHLRVMDSSGGEWLGTGTLLNDNRVLTNHHVLFPNNAKPTSVAITFQYENDSLGQSIASKMVKGQVDTIVNDAQDDWALIETSPPEGIVGFDLAAHYSQAVVGERAFILQHPQGAPKVLAFVRNRISSVTDRRVFYLTDTMGGSSGSPVFNSKGQMIAIHRAGGVPQKLAGVEPVKKNEGVRIDVFVQKIFPLQDKNVATDQP